MYLSVRHFRHFLEGKPFTIFTDHKPLTHALLSSTDNRSPRQTRHLSYVAEFTDDVRYIKGERNIIADALSRPAISAVTVPAIDFAAMSTAQDPAELLATASSLKLKRVHHNNVQLWCDVSGGRQRPLVPLQFRRPIFEALHGLSHAGTRPTIKLISSRFVWPGIRQQIRSWCRDCVPCQASKTGRHTKSPVTVLPPAS